eukprot:gene2566-biopygen2105
MMSSFVKLGGAMFAMGVNFKMAQLLLSNPAALAEKFDSRPAPDPKFKESGKILDFIELLNPMPKGKRKAEESVQDVLDELESYDVSLRKHIRELEIVLADNNIDIIGLNETPLDETVRDSDVNINGYNIYRNDRNANGGGVAMYVKENISDPILKIKSDKLELLALEFTANHGQTFPSHVLVPALQPQE